MLKSKIAIITGAGSGIGLSIVRLFAENGANILAFVHKSNSELEDKFQAISQQNNIWIKTF